MRLQRRKKRYIASDRHGVCAFVMARSRRRARKDARSLCDGRPRIRRAQGSSSKGGQQ